MFDQDEFESLVLLEPISVDKPVVKRGHGSADILEPVLACTGANDAWLLDIAAGEACEDSGILRKSHNIELTEKLAGNIGDMQPFWLGENARIMGVPFLLDGRPTACLLLSFNLEMLLDSKMQAERCAVAAAPFIKAHLQTKRQLAVASQKLEGSMSFLDASYVGVIQFDNRGHMILANSAAMSTINAQDGLRMGSRAPTPVTLKDAARFQLALEHQIAENAENREAMRKSTVLLIRRREGKRPFVVTMISVPKPAVGPGDPAVMLYLFDPSDACLDHLDAICELYGLSQAESRLARHIASGKTVEESAGAMRIKAPTARTYLKHVFMKTGTHRQIDLVRLLMLSTGRISSRAAAEALI